MERHNTFTHGKKQCKTTKSSRIKTIISIKIPRGFGGIWQACNSKMHMENQRNKNSHQKDVEEEEIQGGIAVWPDTTA